MAQLNEVRRMQEEETDDRSGQVLEGLKAVDIHRDAPSSQVGYGGSRGAYDFHARKSEDISNTNPGLGAPLRSDDVNQEGTQENRDTGDKPNLYGHRDYVTGSGGSGSEGYVAELSKYGSVRCNTYPSKAGYSSSSPGYTEDDEQFNTHGQCGGLPCMKGKYGSVHCNTYPSKVGFGGSSRGTYTEDNQQFSTHGQCGGLPTRPEGAVLTKENRLQGPSYGDSEPGNTQLTERYQPAGDEMDIYGDSDVKNGVPHGSTSLDTPSTLDATGETPGENVSANEYHQTKAPLPSHGSPYSHQYTRPITDPSSDQGEERLLGNTMGGTAVDHHEMKGLMRKLKHKLPGHKDDDSSSLAHAEVMEEAGEEKSGFVTKIKDKFIGGHHKHKDENTEAFK